MKKKYKDVMIDIETLGRKSGCAVLTIGAVCFDRYTGELGETFYAAMDREMATLYGHVDPETVKWWERQSDSAKVDAFNGTESPLVIANKFSEWIDGDDLVWGNGSVFDITILEAWFEETCVKIPWKFWNVRDVRTVVDIGNVNPKQFTRKGTYHNALDDAIFQVEYTTAALQFLKDGI